MLNLDMISTERSNENTNHIDELSTLEIVELINQEDQKVAEAVQRELPQIARAVDCIYRVLSKGGRLIYCGCGTSGRLGVLDAAECPPTFGTDYETVQAIMAGGAAAFLRAVEGAEDDSEMGKRDLRSISFSSSDVLVGLAASGRTPYVLGAMEYAKELCAAVIALTCSPGSEMEAMADISIVPNVGPEVITGSTRMKSGTAQKMVLNMLSTTCMIKLGKVYGNLMVDLKATNQKLMERCIRIVCSATGKTSEEARRALALCDNSAKHAIVMLLGEVSEETAKEALMKEAGLVRPALQSLQVKNEALKSLIG